MVWFGARSITYSFGGGVFPPHSYDDTSGLAIAKETRGDYLTNKKDSEVQSA